MNSINIQGFFQENFLFDDFIWLLDGFHVIHTLIYTLNYFPPNIAYKGRALKETPDKVCIMILFKNSYLYIIELLKIFNVLKGVLSGL